jgi:hypothetical protein
MSLFNKLLIGGPNQSHKVNFKELSESSDSLSLFRGKGFKAEQLFFLRQYLFRKKIRKSFVFEAPHSQGTPFFSLRV